MKIIKLTVGLVWWGSYTGNASQTVKFYMGLHLVVSVIYSSTMSAPPLVSTQEMIFLTLLSQWTLFCGCKQFGKEHKAFVWNNSLTSGPVCLITLQNWPTPWKMSCLKCLKYTMCLVNFIFFVSIHFQTVTSWYICS